MQIQILLLIIIFISYKLFKKVENNAEIKDKKEIPQSVIKENKQELPYKKKDLFTKTEYYFYRELKAKCDKQNITIYPKVRLEDYIQVTVKKDNLKYRGYIKSRHIDFLLADNYFRIIAGIELDDRSHNTSKAQTTDIFKNNLFKTVGIPLFRVPVNNTYTEQIDRILIHFEKVDNAKEQNNS